MNNRNLHLQLIQAVITRMAGNSFLLKGWSVTLVSALFALAAAEADFRFAALAYFPAAVFCLLDGYFLNQERRFRALYDHVRALEEDSVDFSMDTSELVDAGGWAKACFSIPALVFHGPILFGIGAVWYVGN